ncbi:hypothetical protein [Streptomyces sp. NPDC004546]|uniref:hypothetical protein n=1 Tax=Streptomyces sp. NPDC004546 TaxID=3154282 RepID=UPI0033BCFD2A
MSIWPELLVVASASGMATTILRLILDGARDANIRILRRGKAGKSITVKRDDGTELVITSESASAAATFLSNYLDEQQKPQRTQSAEVESD